jgi:hypothetical protein
LTGCRSPCAPCSAELEDIVAQQRRYRVPAGSSEGKYFYKSIEQARRFATVLAARGYPGYTVTSATFSAEALGAADEFWADGEGVGLLLPEDVFPLGPVTIHESRT